ncbi:protein yippee-like 2 isoform X3 [Antechinus flavipes]|uniref:protein yippee-like 2 isoform X3 n=1 Tax=Antechinus flavipes TaxID=38775 RepID=UPI002236C00E|nr:protein yippee-like 2 isoform X3 [Antechinus flavipes]
MCLLYPDSINILQEVQVIKWRVYSWSQNVSSEFRSGLGHIDKLLCDSRLLTTCRRPLPASESFLRSHRQCVEPAPHPPPAKTTAFTCVFRCFPCDPSCGSTSWATPEFAQHSAAAPMVKMTRSKTFQAYLPSCHRTYSCIHCRAHLANHDELISKSFQGSQGRAYLFNSVGKSAESSVRRPEFKSYPPPAANVI